MGKRNEHLCPCGSGKRMKLCCRTPAKAAKVALEESALRLAQAGRHAEACQALEQRVALSPTNPMIWNDLGNEYAAAGQPEKAIAALKRARQVDPTFPLPLYNLGIHTLDRCVALQQSPEASTRQAEEMAWEAIGYFNASLVNDPDNAACHRNLARAYAIVKEGGKASAHAMEAIRLTPASERLPNRLLGKAKEFLSRKNPADPAT
jgi:tetratricopeptide (TPR) repeat protein